MSSERHDGHCIISPPILTPGRQKLYPHLSPSPRIQVTMWFFLRVIDRYEYLTSYLEK